MTITNSINHTQGNVVYPTSAAQGDILYASATNTISDLAKDTNATRYLSNTGTSNNPAWAQVNLANGVTGTLPVANGGTGVTSSTPVIQQGRAILQTLLTPLGTTPADNTIPQNTEGTEVFTITITPKSASNILVIEASISLGSSAIQQMTVALFQDSTANALSASAFYGTVVFFYGTCTLLHYMTAGTTSATTFKIRVGSQGAGTSQINGNGGGQLYGGVASTAFTVTEYGP